MSNRLVTKTIFELFENQWFMFKLWRNTKQLTIRKVGFIHFHSKSKNRFQISNVEIHVHVHSFWSRLNNWCGKEQRNLAWNVLVSMRIFKYDMGQIPQIQLYSQLLCKWQTNIFSILHCNLFFLLFCSFFIYEFSLGNHDIIHLVMRWQMFFQWAIKRNTLCLRFRFRTSNLWFLCILCSFFNGKFDVNFDSHKNEHKIKC